MANVFVVDFEQKRVVKSYDTQKEAERRANMKKCGFCAEEYDKRTTILLEGFINIGYGDKPIHICECCITAMHDIVESRKNEEF